LDESDGGAVIRRRHAEYFLDLAIAANLNPGTLAAGGQHLEVAVQEQHNFRAALGWAVASRSTVLGLRLAVALDQFWTTHDPAEGQRWFEALLAEPSPDIPPELRAHALRGYGSSAEIAGSRELAERLWAESLGLFDALGDEAGRATLLHRLGISAMRRGDLDRARELVTASNSIHEGRPRSPAQTWGLAQTIGTQGAIARDAGDTALAKELLGRSAALAVEAGVPWWEGGIQAELACLALAAGGLQEAHERSISALRIARRAADRPGLVFAVAILARVSVEAGDFRRAGGLWGSVEHLDAGAPLGGWRHHRATFAASMGRIEDDAFDRARDRGRTMPLDDAVELALGDRSRLPVSR
jgi:hypothetical protein